MGFFILANWKWFEPSLNMLGCYCVLQWTALVHVGSLSSLAVCTEREGGRGEEEGGGGGGRGEEGGGGGGEGGSE